MVTYVAVGNSLKGPVSLMVAHTYLHTGKHTCRPPAALVKSCKQRFVMILTNSVTSKEFKEKNMIVSIYDNL